MSLMKEGDIYLSSYKLSQKRAGNLTATVVSSDSKEFNMKYTYENHPNYDHEQNHGVNYVRIFEDNDKWILIKTTHLPEELFEL
jgi:hypothetical protein